jgi:hypothetical protein
VQRESSTLRTLQYGVFVAVGEVVDGGVVVVGADAEPAAPELTGFRVAEAVGVLGVVDAAEPARPESAGAVTSASAGDAFSCELQAPQMEANPTTNATLDFAQYLSRLRCMISKPRRGCEWRKLVMEVEPHKPMSRP